MNASVSAGNVKYTYFDMLNSSAMSNVPVEKRLTMRTVGSGEWVEMAEQREGSDDRGAGACEHSNVCGFAAHGRWRLVVSGGDVLRCQP